MAQFFQHDPKGEYICTIISPFPPFLLPSTSPSIFHFDFTTPKSMTMLFLTTLLPFLLPVCAFAAPPLDPTETGGLLFKDLLCIAKTAPVVDEKPVNETAEVQRPKTTCTYQVNYKMNTYYLFGDNWNVTKDTLKASCEKGRSRVLNHWSYREWKDESGDHFCAKVRPAYYDLGLKQWTDRR